MVMMFSLHPRLPRNYNWFSNFSKVKRSFSGWKEFEEIDKKYNELEYLYHIVNINTNLCRSLYDKN